MGHFKFKNMNPWGKKLEDCAIRAVSAALAMKYSAVCELFGKKCVPGTGMAGTEGIDLRLVKKRLGPFFDRVEDANDFGFNAICCESRRDIKTVEYGNLGHAFHTGLVAVGYEIRDGKIVIAAYQPDAVRRL